MKKLGGMGGGSIEGDCVAECPDCLFFREKATPSRITFNPPASPHPTQTDHPPEPEVLTMPSRSSSNRWSARKAARPPYQAPPPNDVLFGKRGGRWGSYDSSCRWCRAPLFYGKMAFNPLVLVAETCSPKRQVRCVQAALNCRVFGPNN